MPYPMLALMSILLTLAPSEDVESPIAKSWAGREVGTSITLRSVTESKGRQVSTTTVDRLVSVDDAKVILERSTTVEADGQTTELESTSLEYRRKFPLLPGVKPEEIGRPKGVVASGQETIEVAGEEYEADWYETEGTTEAGPSTTRSWISDEVPGKLLKSVTKVPAADKTTTITLIEIGTP